MSGTEGPAVADPWSVVGTLVAGPVTWGAIGYGVDAAAGSGVFLPAGFALGFVASLWLVWHRHGRPLTAREGDRR